MNVLEKAAVTALEALNAGDVFVLDSAAWLVTDADHDSDVMCVNLRTGETQFFATGSTVEPRPEAQVVLA